MQPDREIWDAWSAILRYPAEGAEDVARRVRLIGAADPESVRGLGALGARAAEALERGDGGLEELYARTFDWTAERSLDLGWHLHGESYARGALLVRLRGLLREHGVEEGSDLPDHLSQLLRLLGRVEAEMAGALARQVVVPALEKVLTGFGAEEHPYRDALGALRAVLARAFPAPELSHA